MKFIVGIGNSEKKYDKTRHNVGFRALDGLIGSLETEGKRLSLYKKFQADISEMKDTLLIKPETFVNLTGDCISAIVKKYTATPKDFLFVCDDVNLTFGKLRLRNSGSAGGHHGLESVISVLGTDFARLRIGVGSEAMPKDDLTDYVLGKFSAEEEKRLIENFNVAEERQVPGILGKAISICKTWMNEGFEPAMNRLSQLQSIG